jgi:hypothetical protein
MTQKPPEFEAVPVVRLGRPGESRRIQAGVAVSVGLLVLLVIRPWGHETPVAYAPISTAVPSQAAATPRPVETARADGARAYEPALFGRFMVSPRWELWPTAYVYQFGLSGPLAMDGAGSGPGASVEPPPAPAEPPPGAGRLVDIGAADLLMVLGLNTPAGTHVLTARLWRFPNGGRPVQLALHEYPPPWPIDTFHVYGQPVADDREGNLVARWDPGIYRLDLLVEPGSEIHRIGLLVRPPTADAGASPEPRQPSFPPRASVDTSGLGLPVAGAVTLGSPIRLVTLANLEPQRRCDLAELWLAADGSGGPCSPLFITDVDIAAVDLGPDRPVVSLAIREVDPVEATVRVIDRSTPGSTGAVITTADGQPLGDGIYRLVASLADGSEVGWYIRVLTTSGG